MLLSTAKSKKFAAGAAALCPQVVSLSRAINQMKPATQAWQTNLYHWHGPDFAHHARRSISALIQCAATPQTCLPPQILHASTVHQTGQPRRRPPAAWRQRRRPPATPRCGCSQAAPRHGCSPPAAPPFLPPHHQQHGAAAPVVLGRVCV